MVPPFTRVHVCTVLMKNENVQTTYHGIAQYSAPGWTGREMVKFLDNNNISKQAVSDDLLQIAYEPVNGTFTGALTISSEFIAVHPDVGCQKMIRERNIQLKNLSQ